MSEQSFKVYLAGPITGLTFDEAQDWRQYFSSKVDPRIKCYSPLRGKDYLTVHGPLEGSYDEYPLSTEKGITARDRFDCMGSDLVIFNLLKAKRISIGTMIELGWADAMRRPMILIMEEHKPFIATSVANVHEHPMVRAVAPFQVTSVKDALALTEAILLNGAANHSHLQPEYGR